MALAVMGPGAGYALHQELLDEAASVAPALTFHPGADYDSARAAGFASEFQTRPGQTAYAITLSGLSGGQIIVDDLVQAHVDHGVARYIFEIDAPLIGTLTQPTTFIMRAWWGDAPPQSNDDAGVCVVLDFVTSTSRSTHDPCTESVRLQFTLALPPESAGESTVVIRPSGIVLGVPGP